MTVLIPNVYRILYRHPEHSNLLEFYVTTKKTVSRDLAQAWLDRTLTEEVIAVSIDQMGASDLDAEGDICQPKE